jgi:hypothetical protein
MLNPLDEGLDVPFIAQIVDAHVRSFAGIGRIDLDRTGAVRLYEYGRNRDARFLEDGRGAVFG